MMHFKDLPILSGILGTLSRVLSLSSTVDQRIESSIEMLVIGTDNIY